MKRFGRIKYRLSHPANRINKKTGQSFGYGIFSKKQARLYRKARDIVKAGWKNPKAGIKRKRYFQKAWK